MNNERITKVKEFPLVQVMGWSASGTSQKLWVPRDPEDIRRDEELEQALHPDREYLWVPYTKHMINGGIRGKVLVEYFIPEGCRVERVRLIGIE